MPNEVRLMLERREQEFLADVAMRAVDTAGREKPESPDMVRTCYQVDRDRILHSKAFRRLKHKTQVFIDPQGDHYRTRMTHSLEVAQVARTIGRALRLNEDLIEAIALGHDVGHTPFGHAGESALDEALQARTEVAKPVQFRHFEQSLRVLDVLENLNLSWETRAGIGGHSKGRKDFQDTDGEAISTLEAAVVRIADRIAYLNHDLDDALRSGMISAIPSEVQPLGATHGRRVGAMVEDVIVQSLDQTSIRMSEDMMHRLNWMKEWLFDEVYTRYPLVYPDIDKAKGIVRALFNHYCDQPLPDGYNGIQGAVDYVAGMTDRFATAHFVALFVPSTFSP